MALAITQAAPRATGTGFVSKYWNGFSGISTGFGRPTGFRIRLKSFANY